jgi:hypothetical protein
MPGVVRPRPGESETQADERRRYRRYAVKCSCWIERDDATVCATTADVGLGGLFLRTALPMPDGAAVDVVLDLDGLPSIVADGVVTRRIAGQRGVRHGVGVEFVQIRDGRDTLVHFLGGHG